MTRRQLEAACDAADLAAREYHRSAAGRDGAAVGYARLGEIAARMGMEFTALMAFAENRCIPLIYVIERQGIGFSKSGRAAVMQALISAWTDGIDVGRGYNRQPAPTSPATPEPAPEPSKRPRKRRRPWGRR